MFHRLNVCVNLLTATLISIIYVPFPEICDDILYFLVKRLTSLVNRDGEYYCKNFCGCVRPDEQDACSVVEENEPNNEEVEPVIKAKTNTKHKKKPTKEMLELRLEGLKEMLIDDPKNENLSLRIEGLEILVSEAA